MDSFENGMITFPYVIRCSGNEMVALDKQNDILRSPSVVIGKESGTT